jgi:hypothetical protein
MSLYCGIDLHSRNCYLAVLSEKKKLVHGGPLANDLSVIVAALEPYREEIVGIAVESTFNWYWLVDGLMEEGYQLHLANTNEAQQYDGLKYTDDRHDARWLALMLLLGILPQGYIYPKGERPLRDLCRRRSFLVRKRTSFLTSMRGAFGCWTGQQLRRNEIVAWSEEDLEVLLADPRVRLGLSCLLEPVGIGSSFRTSRTEHGFGLEGRIRIGAGLSPHGEPRALDVTLWIPSAPVHTSRPSCAGFPRRVGTTLTGPAPRPAQEAASRASASGGPRSFSGWARRRCLRIWSTAISP